MKITVKHQHFIRYDIKLKNRCYFGYQWLFQENHSGDAVLKYVQSFQGHCEGQGHKSRIHGIRTLPSFLSGIFLRLVYNTRTVYAEFLFSMRQNKLVFAKVFIRCLGNEGDNTGRY